MAAFNAAVQQASDKFLELKLVEGWRLWLDAIHKLHRPLGFEHPERLPEPPWTIKVWASLLLTLGCVMTLLIVVFQVGKEAVIHDFKPNGRFREFYAIPRLLDIQKYGVLCIIIMIFINLLF